MFVDADDVCHPELLQILYQTLVDNQADIAGCCVKNITQDHEFENQNAGHPKIKIFANPLDAFMKKEISEQRFLHVCIEKNCRKYQISRRNTL